VIAEEASRAPAPQPTAPAKAKKSAAAPKKAAAKTTATRPRPKRPVSAKKALVNFFKKSAPAPKKDRRQ
jgi:hypothetical protein